MNDYGDLKPGLYIQRGGSVKAITPTRDGGYVGSWSDVFGGGLSSQSVENLAAAVAWVFVALNKRRQQLLEIPYTWKQGEDELEDTPFDVPFTEFLQQIDSSLQLHGEAYLHKQRDSMGVMGLRWLDPVSIEPDYETATEEDGITRYLREVDGKQIEIPAEDVMRFVVPGLRELRPGVPAGMATKLAASILYGIGTTADTFYDNNALPVMLIKVPAGTQATVIEKLQNEFRRLFNKRQGTFETRTKAIVGDVEVTQLSYKPSELDQTPLSDNQIDQILAAHDVPKSVVLSDAANYSTDIAAQRRFTSAMGARLNYIAEVYNADPDIVALGYVLVPKVDQHYAMQEDEARRSEAGVNFTIMGLTTEAAAWLLGIKEEDFPDGMIVFAPKLDPQEQPQQFRVQDTGIQSEGGSSVADQAGDVGGDTKSVEIAKLRNFVRHGSHLKWDFTSDILTPLEIKVIIADEVGAAQDAPFRDWEGYP